MYPEHQDKIFPSAKIWLLVAAMLILEVTNVGINEDSFLFLSLIGSLPKANKTFLRRPREIIIVLSKVSLR